MKSTVIRKLSTLFLSSIIICFAYSSVTDDFAISIYSGHGITHFGDYSDIKDYNATVSFGTEWMYKKISANLEISSLEEQRGICSAGIKFYNSNACSGNSFFAGYSLGAPYHYEHQYFDENLIHSLTAGYRHTYDKKVYISPYMTVSNIAIPCLGVNLGYQLFQTKKSIEKPIKSSTKQPQVSGIVKYPEGGNDGKYQHKWSYGSNQPVDVILIKVPEGNYKTYVLLDKPNQKDVDHAGMVSVELWVDDYLLKGWVEQDLYDKGLYDYLKPKNGELFHTHTTYKSFRDIISKLKEVSNETKQSTKDSPNKKQKAEVAGVSNKAGGIEIKSQDDNKVSEKTENKGITTETNQPIIAPSDSTSEVPKEQNVSNKESLSGQ